MELKLMYLFGVFVLEVSAVWAVTFYKERKTWPDAVSFCKMSGGELVNDIATTYVPQENAWVGRRIKDGYTLVMTMTNGCYDIPVAGTDVMNVQIRNGSFLECSNRCLGFEYIGVNGKTCYCLKTLALPQMHNVSFCDFITTSLCNWTSPPNMSCGGVRRMSTYRYQTQGFSLPLSYTEGTHAMLCAKWKGQDNGLILTGCEQQLKVKCVNVNGLSSGLHDWNAALKICYQNKTDLHTCDKKASSCLATISSSMKEDGFWVGGFGYNVSEYKSDSVDVSNSSLCGTFDQTGGVVTYLPCGERLPFICKFPSDTTSDIKFVAIVLPIIIIIGLIVAAVILVIRVRKFKRSRKSPDVNIPSRQNVVNQSDINSVRNEYSTIDDPQIGTEEVPRDIDSQVGTTYDEIRPHNSGFRASDKIIDDNYDHVRMMNSSDISFEDNYDHMPVTGLADKNIDDNYDHMSIPNMSAETTDGNYDLMQNINPSAKIIDDDNDHV